MTYRGTPDGERQFIGHRLADIIYLAEKTSPVDDGDWKGYAEALRNLIARQAKEAQTALARLDGEDRKKDTP